MRAEFYGERYPDSDRWVRTNGLSDTARTWAANQSPEFAPLIEAFARGLVDRTVLPAGAANGAAAEAVKTGA